MQDIGKPATPDIAWFVGIGESRVWGRLGLKSH